MSSMSSMSWAEIVKNSNKNQNQPIQHVTSTFKTTSNPNNSSKLQQFPSDINKNDVFKNIWCWGDHFLLSSFIHLLTINEIDDLINNIDYKLHDIDGWSDSETHEDRKFDIDKCREILIRQKKLFPK